MLSGSCFKEKCVLCDSVLLDAILEILQMVSSSKVLRMFLCVEFW